MGNDQCCSRPAQKDSDPDYLKPADRRANASGTATPAASEKGFPSPPKPSKPKPEKEKAKRTGFKTPPCEPPNRRLERAEADEDDEHVVMRPPTQTSLNAPGQGLPPTPRMDGPKPPEEHRDALNAYLDEALAHLKDVKDFVNIKDMEALAAGGPEAQLQMQKDMRAKMAAHMQEVMVPQVSALWDQYDADGNGTLEPDECKKLVKDYLETSVERVPRMIEASMAMGMEIAMQMLDGMMDKADPKPSEDEIKTIKSQVRTQMGAVVPIMCEKVTQVMRKMAEEEQVATISAELLENMDKNHDGHVSKDEFKDTFVIEISRICDTEKMMQQMADWGGM